MSQTAEALLDLPGAARVPAATRDLLLHVARTLPFPAVLIGGTALALRLAHRASLDIDLAIVEPRLPRADVARWIERLAHDRPVADILSPAEIDDAEDHGLDLRDRQQDYDVGGVKLTLLALYESEAERQRFRAAAGDAFGNLVLPPLDLLFFSKALALERRMASRDLFDLAWLMDRAGFDVARLVADVQSVFPHITYEWLRYRLLHWKIAATDPGFAALGVDTDVEQVRARLAEHVAAFERAVGRAFDAQAGSDAP
jgi:hypothetical protein